MIESVMEEEKVNREVAEVSCPEAARSVKKPLDKAV